MHFEYSHISVAQKLTELQIFCCHGYSRVNLEKSRFLADSFFYQLICWQLIYVTTDFLTTKFFDSLSNYKTYQLGVWDSRPLVLFYTDCGICSLQDCEALIKSLN